MTDSAALLADEVLPQKPLRQWVLSLPFALRFLLATDAEALTQVLGVVYRTGFSLHAEIGVEADQREKLERLARYVSRPPVSVERPGRRAV